MKSLVRGKGSFNERMYEDNMKRRIKAVSAIMLALMCVGTPLVPTFADLFFRETGAAAWCVRRGCARDPLLASRQVTEAADGIRVTLNAADSDLKPWSWGSINATRNIHLDNVQDGAVVQLRIRCSNPPLVGNDVSIGIEDAASNRIPLVRLTEENEGAVTAISFRIREAFSEVRPSITDKKSSPLVITEKESCCSLCQFLNPHEGHKLIFVNDLE